MKELITAVIKSKKAKKSNKKSQKQTLNKKQKQKLKIAIALVLAVVFFSGSAVLIANAKEKKSQQREQQRKEEQGKLTEIICKQLPENSSVVDPEIDEYKTRELCKKEFPQEFTEEIKKDAEKEEFKKELAEILDGTPMENMIDAISERDRIVAAFLVGIALKESGLGRRVPVDASGSDCFNYWGFRSRTERMGTGGHSCFNSPEEAVEIVGKRLHQLAVEYKRNTPQKMLVWKCGSSCATHSPASVSKWVSDVSIYFNKLNG